MKNLKITLTAKLTLKTSTDSIEDICKSLSVVSNDENYPILSQSIVKTQNGNIKHSLTFFKPEEISYLNTTFRIETPLKSITDIFPHLTVISSNPNISIIEQDLNYV
jgi:hypothetical protein